MFFDQHLELILLEGKKKEVSLDYMVEVCIILVSHDRIKWLCLVCSPCLHSVRFVCHSPIFVSHPLQIILLFLWYGIFRNLILSFQNREKNTLYNLD